MSWGAHAGEIGHLDYDAVAVCRKAALKGEVGGVGNVEGEGISGSRAAQRHDQGRANIAANHLGANGAHRGGGGDSLAGEAGAAVGGDVDSDRAAGVASEAHTPIAFSHRKFGDVGDVDGEALAVDQAAVSGLDGY